MMRTFKPKTDKCLKDDEKRCHAHTDKSRMFHSFHFCLFLINFLNDVAWYLVTQGLFLKCFSVKESKMLTKLHHPWEDLHLLRLETLLFTHHPSFVSLQVPKILNFCRFSTFFWSATNDYLFPGWCNLVEILECLTPKCFNMILWWTISSCIIIWEIDQKDQIEASNMSPNPHHPPDTLFISDSSVVINTSRFWRVCLGFQHINMQKQSTSMHI